MTCCPLCSRPLLTAKCPFCLDPRVWDEAQRGRFNAILARADKKNPEVAGIMRAYVEHETSRPRSLS